MNVRDKMEHYEMLYENERAMTNELKTEIKDHETKLRRSIQGNPMAIGHGSNYAAVQHLETEAKVAQVRAQDLTESEEVHECMCANIRLRDELTDASEQGSSAHFGSQVAILKSELDSERKLKLASGAQQYERSCEYLGELRERDEKLKLKESEIMVLRNSLKEAETIIKYQGDSNMLPDSAGMPHNDQSSTGIIGPLEKEVRAANDEATVRRAWVRQLDEALKEESNAAQPKTALTVEQAYQQPVHPEQQRVSELLRDVNRKISSGIGVRVAAGAGIPDYKAPSGGDGPNFPNGPPDPDGPPGPPNPPGLPSLRGSQRESAIDIESTAAFTADEPPRISRREADKLYVSPWPKHQNLGFWQSDLIKSVCLAAKWRSNRLGAMVATGTQAEPRHRCSER
jgi:hypothetical protein